MAEEIEVVEEDVVEDRSPLLAGARRVLMAGIGVVALAQEEIEDFVNKLVERGEIAEKDGRKLVNDIMERRQKKSRESAEKLEAELDKRLESLLGHLNVPTKANIEALSVKIAELTRKVDELKKNLS